MYRFGLKVMLAVAAAVWSGCTSVVPDFSSVETTDESEPNDSAFAAQTVSLDGDGRARLAGMIQPSTLDARLSDADFFSLGALAAGDHVLVDVDTSDSELDAVLAMAVFDADNVFAVFPQILVVNDDQNAATEPLDPLLDIVMRRDAAEAVVILSRSPKSQANGEYELKILVERGGTAPPPQRQTVVLDFDGGTLSLAEGRTLTVGPFDAASIDQRYAEHTTPLIEAIVETVRQNYARFNLEILSTDEPVPTGSFSTVYFGGFDPQGFGIAPFGTDPFNSGSSDDAIVFTESFRPDVFTSPPDVSALGTAIGNVAAHELGHLLGLEHTFGTTSLMNALASLEPDVLLSDLRFVDVTVIDTLLLEVPDAVLAVGEIGLLNDIVGPAGPVAATVLPVGASPSDVTVGDWDGDGDIDLAITNQDAQTVSIRLNNGRGAFMNSPDVPVVGSLGQIETAALRGDGVPGLAVLDLFADGLFLVFGRGDGTFPEVGRVFDEDFGLSDFALADLDGDGDPDFGFLNSFFSTLRVVANDAVVSTMEPSTLDVGDALPTFDDLDFSSIDGLSDVIAADVDGDGDADLVTAWNFSGLVPIFLNDGNGAFQSGEGFGLAIGDVPPNVQEIGAADLDRDGDLDLVLVVQGLDAIAVALNDGDGGFAQADLRSVGDNPEALVFADLDGDGAPDLAVTNLLSGDVSVLLNRGDGTLTAERVVRTVDVPTAIAAADLDGDGDVDLVVAHRNSDSISILFNDGRGGFGRSADVPDADAFERLRGERRMKNGE